MRSVVFSIKPHFVDLILSGQKRFEYRKIIIKKPIDKIIIYATSPICKVVGEARVKNVLVENPDELWFKTSEFSGVDRKFYNDYFANCSTAIAFELYDVIRYYPLKTLNELGLNFVPQSFVYLPEGI